VSSEHGENAPLNPSLPFVARSAKKGGRTDKKPLRLASKPQVSHVSLARILSIN